MKQLYRIKVTNGTASYCHLQGKVYECEMQATREAGSVYYAHKWLFGDDHGINTVVEPYEPEPLGFTAAEITEAAHTIAQILHRNNPYT